VARPFCFVLERAFSFSRSHNTQAVWVCKKNLQKSFHRGDGERQPHWPTTSQPQSKADCFLIVWTAIPPAPDDQTRHEPRQSRTVARYCAFAVLAGGKHAPAQFPHRI
jgi:hypothetical protein